MIKDNSKIISFSQKNSYEQCQYKWYLNYPLKKRTRGSNINLIFGNAMHEALQEYIKVLYNESVQNANKIDLQNLLLERMKHFFSESITINEETEQSIHPASKEEMLEYYEQGSHILDFFKKHRADYFNKKGWELIGIEHELNVEMSNNKVFFGKIDVILKDIVSKKYRIIDLKTSGRGWRDYKKKDKSSTDQVLLYKRFFSQLYDVPEDKIDVQFIILKRTLYENTDYPQKRIQLFVPANGKPSVNSAITDLQNFITACFHDDGSFNLDRTYLKNPTKLCDWCDHSTNGNCDKKN